VQTSRRNKSGSKNRSISCRTLIILKSFILQITPHNTSTYQEYDTKYEDGSARSFKTLILNNELLIHISILSKLLAVSLLKPSRSSTFTILTYKLNQIQECRTLTYSKSSNDMQKKSRVSVQPLSTQRYMGISGASVTM
jgi:hypothetical protein